VVTIMMFPMVRMATNTHCTTCCRHPCIWLMDTTGHGGHVAGTLVMEAAQGLGPGICGCTLGMCGQEHTVKKQGCGLACVGTS
jgi:hypothetical protein